MAIITVKIDVTKIDKARLFTGREKDGKTPKYLDMVLIDTKPTNFGDSRDQNTHMVVQSVTKEERLKGIKGNILGNASEFRTKPQGGVPPPTAAETADEQPESDDVPF